jgi:hypothetical protein
MEAYSHWRSLQYDRKDIESFTSQYTYALRRLDAFKLNMDAELKAGMATNKQLVKLTRRVVEFGKQTRLVVLSSKQGKLSQGLQAL